MTTNKLLSDCPVTILQDEQEFNEFRDFYRSLNPKKVLEIGSFFGGTMYYFLKDAQLSDFFALDLPIPPSDERYAEMIASRGLWPSWKEKFIPNGLIHDIQGNSHDQHIIEQVHNLIPNNDIDVLHIDGDHSYQGVKADYENYKDLVKPGGVIVFHDIFGIDDVNAFWKEISKIYPKIRQISFPDGWGIGILYV